MTRVLVAFAGRFGSTGELALTIGGELLQPGQHVDVYECDRAPDARHYDVVIIGSEVHHQHWLKEALGYLRHHAPDLAERPTYLFQIVDTGSHATAVTPSAVTRLAYEVGVAGPQTFDLAGTRPEEPRGHAPSGWLQRPSW